MPVSYQVGQKFLQLLEASGALTPDERDAVLALPSVVRVFHRRQVLAREGDMPSQCCIVIDGLVYRSLVSNDGSRQIFSFHIAGDMPDLQSLMLPQMDHDRRERADDDRLPSTSGASTGGLAVPASSNGDVAR